ncbi:MAG: hypothetical protein V1667_02210 [bacterium]
MEKLKREISPAEIELSEAGKKLHDLAESFINTGDKQAVETVKQILETIDKTKIEEMSGLKLAIHEKLMESMRKKSEADFMSEVMGKSCGYTLPPSEV